MNEQKELLQAIANFQQEVPPLIKDAKGHGYRYTTLSQVLEIILPFLKKNNLGQIQRMIGERTLQTIIYHLPTGQSITSESELPTKSLNQPNEAQNFGASITYFRRYHLTCMLGLITETDTDAVSVKTPAKQEKTTTPQKLLQKFDGKGFSSTWTTIIKDKHPLKEIKKFYIVPPDLEQELLSLGIPKE